MVESIIWSIIGKFQINKYGYAFYSDEAYRKSREELFYMFRCRTFPLLKEDLFKKIKRFLISLESDISKKEMIIFLKYLCACPCDKLENENMGKLFLEAQCGVKPYMCV